MIIVMEQRVGAVELRLKEFEYEFKAINKTLAEISSTLTEIKVLNSNVVEVRNEVMLSRRNYELLDGQVKKLFEYYDALRTDVGKLYITQSNDTARNNVKIGYAERIIWGVMAAALASWGVLSGK